MVDGLFALHSAARSCAGGEDHSVGAGQMSGNLVRAAALQVDDDRFGAGRLQVGGVVGVADEPGDRVAAVGQQLLGEQRDLAVSAGDDDAHVLPP